MKQYISSYLHDYTEYNYPSNVHVHYMGFDELRKLVQSNFNFQIELPTAYKLCDFRAAYGEIFKEYLTDYDFWGYCDIDLIWGNIRHYVTDELMERYVRVGAQGHCSLFKNTEEVNAFYRTLTADGYKSYCEVFSNRNNLQFDEWPGTSSVMKINNVPFYHERHHADLDCDAAGFRVHYRPEIRGAKSCFVYDDGNLYWTDGKQKLDFLYVHFQKRKLSIKINDSYNRFALYQPGIVKNIPGGYEACGLSLYEKCGEYVKFYARVFIRRSNNLKRKLGRKII